MLFEHGTMPVVIIPSYLLPEHASLRRTPAASRSMFPQARCCSSFAVRIPAAEDPIALSLTLNECKQGARAPLSWHGTVRRAAVTSFAQLCCSR